MDPAEESLTVLLPPPRPLLLKEPPSHFDPPDSSHRPWYAPYFHQSQQAESQEKERADEENLLELRKILARLQQNAPPAKMLEPSPAVPPLLRSSKHYMKEHVDTVLRVEESLSKVMKSEEECLEWLTEWISSLTEKMMEMIRENNAKLKEQSIWSNLSKIVSGILSSIALIFGISLVTSPAGGMAAGTLLIASSLLSILNLMFEETKMWEWTANTIAGDDQELKKTLRFWLPAGINILSLIIGSAGSLGALFMEAFNWTQQSLLMGKTAADIAKHIAKMKEGVIHSESLKIQAEGERLQTSLNLSDGPVNGALEVLKKMAEALKESCKGAREALSRNASLAREIQV